MSTKILTAPRRCSYILQKKLYRIQHSEHRTILSAQNVRKAEQNNQSTIDKDDVNLFSQHMKEWWDPNGPMKPLHSMNLLRVPFVRDGLAEDSPNEQTCTPLKDKKILDVGCGGGILSEALARLGADVTGIDASKGLIDLAEQHKHLDERIADHKPNYLCVTIEDHVKECSNHYDGVVASEVIEHVNNKELFVKSCIQAVKPGGRIFFTTPNRTRASQVLGIWAAEYILNILPKGTHQYEKFITPTELTFLLERNGCHVEIVYGVMYHFILNRWEFVPCKELMFALQALKTS